MKRPYEGSESSAAKRAPTTPPRESLVLGRGTFATVFKVRDPEDPSECVALKQYDLKDSRVEQGFPIEALREIRALRQCASCPYVVNLRGVVVCGMYPRANTVLHARHQVAISLDLYPGTISDAVVVTPRMVTDVIKGLEFIWKSDIVHRDVKRSNILHDPISKRTVLADFGSCRLMSTRETHTLGITTPSVEAPELKVRRSDCRYDELTDSFALGTTLSVLPHYGSLQKFFNAVKHPDRAQRRKATMKTYADLRDDSPKFVVRRLS